MKTLKLFSLLAVLFSFVLLESCTKEMPEDQITVQAKKKGGEGSGSQCLAGVEVINGVLNFDSVEELEAVYECLTGEYQGYISDQVATVNTMPEEDAYEFLAENGYNDNIPLLTFETGASNFTSLRSALAPALADWLQSEELIAADNPYLGVPGDKVMATLISSNGEIGIAGEIISVYGEEQRMACNTSAWVTREVQTCGRKMIGYLFHRSGGTDNFGASMVGGITATYKKVWILGWVPAVFHKSVACKSGNLRIKDAEGESCTEQVGINNSCTEFWGATIVIQFYGFKTYNDPDDNHIRTRHSYPHCSNLQFGLTN